MASEPPPISYLLECSQNSLKSFLTAQLNKSANSRKELRAVLDEWVEARAMALLAEWLLVHGAEILTLSTQPQPETPKQEEPKHEKPLLTTYEFWRSEQRHVRRRAG